MSESPVKRKRKFDEDEENENHYIIKRSRQVLPKKVVTEPQKKLEPKRLEPKKADLPIVQLPLKKSAPTKKSSSPPPSPPVSPTGSESSLLDLKGLVKQVKCRCKKKRSRKKSCKRKRTRRKRRGRKQSPCKRRRRRRSLYNFLNRVKIHFKY